MDQLHGRSGRVAYMVGLTFVVKYFTEPLLKPYFKLFDDNLPIPMATTIAAGILALIGDRIVLARLYNKTPPGNKREGYSSVAVYPHKDWLLGMDWFLETLGSMKTYRFLELTKSRFIKYGDTHYSIALGRWLCLTNDTENIKTILATNMEDWPIAGPRQLAVLPVVGKKSVFSSNGADWHKARSMLRPSFVRDQVADLQCFDRHASHFIDAIPKDGSAFDIQPLVMAMTMDSSTDFLLGYSTNNLINPTPEAKQFIADFEYAAHESAKKARLGTLLFWIPHKKLEAASARLREFLQFYLRKAVKEKGAKERNYVFLDEMLDSGASEGFILDQILSVIVAGRDTTATALTSCLWFLSRDPEAVKKLRKEIIDLNTSEPTWEELKNMKYLNNVIREALRLVPPVATNARQANKDTILPVGGGPDGTEPILVPKGTAVRWSTYCLHRRKDIFGEDAESFRPERWEDLRVTWEYIPFSGGPRICLGQQFALTQITLALFRFFETFETIEAQDHGPLALNLNLTASFAKGCPVKLTSVNK